MKHTSADARVAKKYAQAFLNVLSKDVSFQDIEKIITAQTFLQDHKRTLFFLQLPQFNQATRRSMVEDIVNHFVLRPELIDLLLLLVDHNRSFLIPEVLSCIVALYKKSHDIMDFAVTSAGPITEERKHVICSFLQKVSGKNSMGTYSTDKNLIAGLRVQSVEYMWEYSVRKQLDCLRELERDRNR